MTGKHTKRLAESTGDGLTVQFSPEVTRQFSRLEAAVHRSEHFAPEIFWILQDMTERKPQSVRGAILSIAAIVHEAGEYIHATGDEKTADTLTALLEALSPAKGASYPISVTKRAAISPPPFNGR